jgi:hypothetical protein
MLLNIKFGVKKCPEQLGLNKVSGSYFDPIGAWRRPKIKLPKVTVVYAFLRKGCWVRFHNRLPILKFSKLKVKWIFINFFVYIYFSLVSFVNILIRKLNKTFIFFIFFDKLLFFVMVIFIWKINKFVMIIFI